MPLILHGKGAETANEDYEALETQLLATSHQQADAFREIISALSSAPASLQQAQRHLASLAGACQHASSLIENFPVIQSTSRVYKNFADTRRMWLKFEELDARVERTAQLIEEDRSTLTRSEKPHNILLVYYYLCELEAFEKETMSFVGAAKSPLASSPLGSPISSAAGTLQI